MQKLDFQVENQPRAAYIGRTALVPICKTCFNNTRNDTTIEHILTTSKYIVAVFYKNVHFSQETTVHCVLPANTLIFDGRGSIHLGPAVGLKTLSIHVCVCPHFGM